MEDLDGEEHRMLLMRDPKGTTDYSGPWNADDEAWDFYLTSKVPMNIDPTTSQNDGIFAVPLEKLAKSAECFTEFYIGHNRGELGYSQHWFDALDMDDAIHRYKAQIPRKTGTTLYFNVESYYPDIVPTSCSSGTYTYMNIMDKEITVELETPVLYFALFKQGTRNKLDFKVHADSYANPIVVVDYEEGDVFEIDAQYKWHDTPARDYTVSIYS